MTLVAGYRDEGARRTYLVADRLVQAEDPMGPMFDADKLVRFEGGWAGFAGDTELEPDMLRALDEAYTAQQASVDLEALSRFTRRLVPSAPNRTELSSGQVLVATFAGELLFFDHTGLVRQLDLSNGEPPFLAIGRAGELATGALRALWEAHGAQTPLQDLRMARIVAGEYTPLRGTQEVTIDWSSKGSEDRNGQEAK